MMRFFIVLLVACGCSDTPIKAQETKSLNFCETYERERPYACDDPYGAYISLDLSDCSRTLDNWEACGLTESDVSECIDVLDECSFDGDRPRCDDEPTLKERAICSFPECEKMIECGEQPLQSPDAGLPADTGPDASVEYSLEFLSAAEVIRSNCLNAACHGAPSANAFSVDGGETASLEEIYTALHTDTLTASGMRLVTPRSLDESALFVQVDHEVVLTDPQRNAIRDWIILGATR